MTDTAFEPPRALNIVVGYLASVLVAALTVATVMAWADPFSPPFWTMLFVGGCYILAAGLPGFAITAALARRHGWSGWAPFTVCGGLNVVLAWLLIVGANVLDHELFQASLRGGVAGGVTYCWVAYHGLQRFRMAGPSALR